jgi:hypothetical protein
MRHQPVRLLLALVAAGAWLASDIPAASRSPDLPDRLTARQFWQLSADLSEPGDTFISDNLVSNERAFAQVVPALVALGRPGSVYVGVGPEQNFTYLAAMRAGMAFVVDLRRENLLLHLMYKALFDLSPDRRTFLSRLFSRSFSERPGQSAAIAALMDAVAAAPAADEAAFRRNADDLRRVLVEQYRLPLSVDDLGAIERMHRAFVDHGPAIGYATTLTGRPGTVASYANLMKQADGAGQALGYLGTEASYQFVRNLQARHLVIPVIGNFAGPKALHGIGAYLRSRGATVSAFYVSNVEDYLHRPTGSGQPAGPKNGDWSAFCANVAAMPVDDRSVFIRPIGLAAFDDEGRVMTASQMVVESPRDLVTLPAGSVPTWPSALSLILPEVSRCGARGPRCCFRSSGAPGYLRSPSD